MRRFLRRFSIFISLFFLLNIGLLCLNAAIVRGSGLLVIPTPLKTLVLGNSHTQCALDDSIISEALNASSAADSYLYSFVKLRALVEANPTITTVILAFSHGVLFETIEEEWTFNPAHVRSKLSRNYPLMKPTEMLPLFQHQPQAALWSLLSVPRQLGVLAYRFATAEPGFQTLDLGGFRNLERDKLELGIERIVERGPRTNFNYSHVEQQFLDKIIAFCAEKHITLYLMNTPKHATYYRVRPTEAEVFYEFYDANYAHTMFLDFKDYEMPDDCFADVMHLNQRGAKIFSEYLEREGWAKIVSMYRHRPEK